ncbi:MAG: DUF5666 domain-containing protein [Patescibacteria group bacterium]
MSIKSLLAFAVVLGIVGSVMLASPWVAFAKKDKDKGGDDDSHGKKEFRVDTRDNREDDIPSGASVQINGNGKSTLQNIRVDFVSASSTISGTITWGSFSLRVRVEVDGSTNFVRRFSGNSSMAEISVGDFLTVQGMLRADVADTLTVRATHVKNWSVQKRNASFFGKVTSVMASSTSFMLDTEERGAQTIIVGSSTEIMKAGIRITFSDIRVGDKINAHGVWNNLQNTLDAQKIKVFVDRAVLQKIFEGKLQSTASTTAPTAIVIRKSGTDYTVQIAHDTSILNKFWARATLSQFLVGHKIRVYGALEGTTINATVVRNESLQ